MSQSQKLEEVFTAIYNQDLWNMGQTDSKSGLGSSDDFTKHIRMTLLEVINRYHMKNMIDTSCGDLYWMKTILPFVNCDYLGLDIVQSLIETNREVTKKISNDHAIEFKHAAFLEYINTLPDQSVDLILCRHTCEHLPTDYVIQFIKEAKRVSKYLLLTTHKHANANRDVEITETPYRPINLNLTPYSELLDSYQINSFYDGPASHIRSEMYINMYQFH
jgi:ubiquinone/menaquinone biosynthesis C-methylase UbiE